MTVSSTVTRVTYTGNGVTTAFATTFPFFTAGEIEVIERVIATGAETVKTLTTHYAVSGGDGATGTVTAVGGAPSAAVQWIIRRKTARTQEIDYTPNDPFPAETHEQGLDRLKMNVQELGEETDRALKFPKTDSASLGAELPSSVERASKYLAFDASGEPMATAGTADATPHNAFMIELHGAADAAAARDTLGLAIGSDVLAPDGDGSQLTGITAVPAGAVMAYAGAAAPSGWLLCDGAAISRTTYAALFTAIGTTHGTGDGTTTFNLPDLRGRVAAGKDDMGGTSANRLTNQSGGVDGDTLGATGGEEAHTQTLDELVEHDHTYSQPSGSITAGSGGGAASTSGAAADTSATGGGDPFNVVQPTIILNYIIKM